MSSGTSCLPAWPLVLKINKIWLIWNVGYPRWLFWLCWMNKTCVERCFFFFFSTYSSGTCGPKHSTLIIHTCYFWSIFHCCSVASPDIPEDGVNAMVMTWFLISMRISGCQSFLPWGFALAQPWSKWVLGDEWIRMHKSKRILVFFCLLLSFFVVMSGAYSFLFPWSTLTFSCCITFRCFKHGPVRSTSFFFVRYSFSLLHKCVSSKDVAKIGKQDHLMNSDTFDT